MKRQTQRGFLLLLTVLLLSQVACSDPKESAEDSNINTIAMAQEKAAKADSASATTVTSMDIILGNASQSYHLISELSMDIAMNMQPRQAHISFRMDMGELPGGVADSEVYILEEEGVLNSYTYSLGQWTKAEVTPEEIERYNLQAAAELYLGRTVAFVEEGEELLANGTPAKKYTGVISDEDIADVLDATGVANSMSGLTGDNTINWSLLYENMSGMTIPISIWISEDGYPIRYEIDLTQIMHQLLVNMLSHLGTDENTIAITTNSVTMTMDCTYNQGEEIILPQEAIF